MRRAWTWAVYHGQQFGKGLVACHEDRVAKVWLPTLERNGHSMIAELEAFGIAELLEATAGGFAAEVSRQLTLVFSEGLDVTRLPYDIAGLTPFSQQVMRACQRIAHGKTASYKVLADQVGKPLGSRAVGNVMAKNPLPLIVPCHRVISADGSLGSYGGGVAMKRWLLHLEGVL